MKDLLHIYIQAYWHESVEIAGDEESLIRLANAILRAVNGHREPESIGYSTEQFFTNDGEGYNVNVYQLTPAEMDVLRLPYYDEIAQDNDSSRLYPFQVCRQPGRPMTSRRLSPPLPTKPNMAGDAPQGFWSGESIWSVIQRWFNRLRR